jgi:hypothetical protein
MLTVTCFGTVPYQGAWLVKFQNQQPVVCVVTIVRIMCVTVAYKTELKYGYDNECSRYNIIYI